MLRKVDKDDVFLCTIKKCLNVKEYNQHGDKEFIPFSRINSMVEGTEVSYTEVVDSNAVVIRINDDYYVKLEDVEKSKIKLKRNCYLTFFPSDDGDLFIDKKSLVPYFGEITGEKQKVNPKTLTKKTVGQCVSKKQ